MPSNQQSSMRRRKQTNESKPNRYWRSEPGLSFLKQIIIDWDTTKRHEYSNLKDYWRTELADEIAYSTLQPYCRPCILERKIVKPTTQKLISLEHENEFCRRMALQFPVGDLSPPVIISELANEHTALSKKQLRQQYDAYIKEKIVKYRFSNWSHGRYLYLQKVPANRNRFRMTE